MQRHLCHRSIAHLRNTLIHLRNTGFNRNISITFIAIQKLSAHPTIACIGVFYKFLGDFGLYLGGDSFSQRIGKIRRNQTFVRFNVGLKLEFEMKISRLSPRQSLPTWGALTWGVNCLVVFQNYFSFFYIPSSNLLKSHSISCLPSP